MKHVSLTISGRQIATNVLWIGLGFCFSLRQSIIPADEWIHLAWVWGERAQVGGRGTVQSITTRIYLNGKAGKQYSWGDKRYLGQYPADMPDKLLLGPGIEAAYDELRVSDIQRYTDDFTPPARDRELTLDENTRALFHFNGNIEGQSHGFSGALPVELK